MRGFSCVYLRGCGQVFESMPGHILYVSTEEFVNMIPPRIRNFLHSPKRVILRTE
jgi:hypothetical protein